jgi:translation initiation factor eIF-2B subunit beta
MGVRAAQDMVKRQQWDTPIRMLLTLRGLGRRLILAQPLELVVGSMIRRVLFLLREEMARVAFKAREKTLNERKKQSRRQEDVEDEEVSQSAEEEEDDDGEGAEGLDGRTSPESAVPSLRGVMADLHDLDMTELPVGHNWKGLKKTMMEAILELRSELDNVNDPIARQSIEYIHAREVVLVYGLSRAVEAFFVSAHEQRLPHFEVFVAETPDGNKGHEMALKLASRGIDTTVITDSAIFGLMARVNKVIVAAHAVLANGGMLSDCGTNMVATAAKHYSVPVICVTVRAHGWGGASALTFVQGLYKLCPLYPFSQDTFNDLRCVRAQQHADALPAARPATSWTTPTSPWAPARWISSRPCTTTSVRKRWRSS